MAQRRVIDYESGKPAGCAIKITDAHGRAIWDEAVFEEGIRCSGHFEKQLPPGKTRILISRRGETQGECRDLDLIAGHATELQFRLQRRVNLSFRHSYSGDCHAGVIHGEKKLAATFAKATLAAQAEDLQCLSVAQDWPLARFTAALLQKTLGA